MSKPPELNEDIADVTTRATTVFPDGSELHTVTNDPVGMLPGTVMDKLPGSASILAELAKSIGKEKLQEMMAKTLGICKVIEKTENQFCRYLMQVNYGRVPSKRAGRKGTRRDWKRSHPPKKVKWTWLGDGIFSIEPPPRLINHTVIISGEADHGMG